MKELSVLRERARKIGVKNADIYLVWHYNNLLIMPTQNFSLSIETESHSQGVVYKHHGNSWGIEHLRDNECIRISHRVNDTKYSALTIEDSLKQYRRWMDIIPNNHGADGIDWRETNGLFFYPATTEDIDECDIRIAKCNKLQIVSKVWGTNMRSIPTIFIPARLLRNETLTLFSNKLRPLDFSSDTRLLYEDGVSVSYHSIEWRTAALFDGFYQKIEYQTWWNQNGEITEFLRRAVEDKSNVIYNRDRLIAYHGEYRIGGASPSDYWPTTVFKAEPLYKYVSAYAANEDIQFGINDKYMDVQANEVKIHGIDYKIILEKSASSRHPTYGQRACALRNSANGARFAIMPVAMIRLGNRELPFFVGYPK